MNPFKHFDEKSLLKKHTEFSSNYSKYLADSGDDNEFNECRVNLEYLMLEIEVRRSQHKQKESKRTQSRYLFHE